MWIGALVSVVLSLAIIGAFRSRAEHDGPERTTLAYLRELDDRIDAGDAENAFATVVPAFFDPVSCTIPNVRFEDAFHGERMRLAPIFEYNEEVLTAYWDGTLEVHTAVQRGGEAYVQMKVSPQLVVQQRLTMISSSGKEAWFFVCA